MYYQNYDVIVTGWEMFKVDIRISWENEPIQFRGASEQINWKRGAEPTASSDFEWQMADKDLLKRIYSNDAPFSYTAK